jgi:hypothetical protein
MDLATSLKIVIFYENGMRKRKHTYGAEFGSLLVEKNISQILGAISFMK